MGLGLTQDVQRPQTKLPRPNELAREDEAGRSRTTLRFSGRVVMDSSTVGWRGPGRTRPPGFRCGRGSTSDGIVDVAFGGWLWRKDREGGKGYA